ncbi:MAG: RIP metalloprotease RseP [Candidatus Andersenbacteria bacterium RIFCSPHIGHO2_12_FULL_45_11b]|uniref:Zinc metalloprotease n=1 Tax=Candidatus Andersenbacteria bacterium RIFCSPHIGHO2_12_FULL_45_11b TaxID=1797282 RepID=A0A1G1X981_9BACT|nr:MAG: RIP metalloprotease RseP [Candidatus Andersenbacteria bacterium RIFCSPHIGHO2_12_FULL_45_11b]
MSILIIAIFIAMLLVLVLVHEWGHFFVAKKAGCTVEEFGFGFPPRLLSKKWRGTLYSLNLFPIGGFVKIEGENMDETSSSPTSFASKSALWRIAILSAGVGMNLLFAAFLLTIESAIGAPTLVTDKNMGTLTDIKTYAVEIIPGSPAQEAGMQIYDHIISIEGIQDPSLTAVQQITRDHAGSPLHISLDRNGQDIDVIVTPRINPPEGQGALGISLSETGLEKTPLWLAPIKGIERTGIMIWAIVSQFGILIAKLFEHQSVGQALTGPIGIAIYTKQAVTMGLSYFLEFAAMISINLAIINILPIPALDGGRILFVGIEKLAGRKRTASVEQYAHTIGFIALIGLMLFITFKDIRHYF